MPQCTWEQINEELHKCKAILQRTYTIEQEAKKMRGQVGEVIENINEIILQQKENKNNE